MVAKDRQDGYRRERFDLVVGVVRRTATGFDEDEPLGHGGIEERRGQGKPPGLRVAHQHRPIQFGREIDSALKVGLGVGTPPKLTSGTPCFESSSTAETGN